MGKKPEQSHSWLGRRYNRCRRGRRAPQRTANLDRWTSTRRSTDGGNRSECSCLGSLQTFRTRRSRRTRSSSRISTVRALLSAICMVSETSPSNIWLHFSQRRINEPMVLQNPADLDERSLSIIGFQKRNWEFFEYRLKKWKG